MSQDAQGFNAPITEDDIANYLLNTPDFFERHVEILSAVQLSSPHSHRTISLQERQAEIMRGKIRELELAQSHMVRFGQNNVAIADKLNDWTTDLLAAADATAVVDAVTQGLAQAYDFSQVGLKCWGVDGLPDTVQVAADAPLAQAVAAVGDIVCGPKADGPVLEALADAVAVASMAIVPLRSGDAAWGVLVLASDDEQRFTADMGTLFLARVGVLASAALRRFGPTAA